AGAQERRHHLEPLPRPALLLALAGPEALPHLLGSGLRALPLPRGLDRLGPHSTGEVLAHPVALLPAQQLLRHALPGLRPPGRSPAGASPPRSRSRSSAGRAAGPRCPPR